MDLTLVVMAAGMSSRFGSLKQITPVDEDCNFIMDYSIHDAICAGFKKIVFVIKEEYLEVFQNTIGKRISDKAEVCYAFQKIEDIPVSLDISKRSKPWGTVQAILSSRPYVDGSFVLINADDFYGPKSFLAAAKFLRENQNSYTYANISYAFGTTKSLKGAVKRGVLTLDGDQIKLMIECSIDEEAGKIVATPLNGKKPFEMEENHPVSMNFFAFQKDIYEILEEYWENYFKQDESQILENEVLLPECLNEYIANGQITILNQPSKSIWLGMTYKEDLHVVKTNIQVLKDEEKLYKQHLWEDFSGNE